MRRNHLFAVILAASLTLAAAQAAPPDRPMFARAIGLRGTAPAPPAIPTWTYLLQNHRSSTNVVFVGVDPMQNQSVTVPVYLIPVALTYKGRTASPLATLPNGQTIVQNTLTSPMFVSALHYHQGSADLGVTQYIDAWQRGNLWQIIEAHPNAHVLLGQPVVENAVTLKVPPNMGSVGLSLGTEVVRADINWFDFHARQLIRKMHVPRGALVLFETANTYLTEFGGCCVGGYHNYANGSTYGHFTYITRTGAFAQDVSALSHEVGEWVDDPFVNNPGCPNGDGTFGLLEVGDPLENARNYGDYPYALGGFTYHLQDLVDVTYFGAPLNTTAGGEQTFHGTPLTYCADGS